ncbi:hypothetical protein EVG20_g1568 [Dentipellis fragilis]|uniref:FAD dependent oxidoreductase domain-containing protein n=1 Tax=Dentipellis fragilis TaxID=205917 RepID=A0A4Y9ZCC3_9AGAM|nr:hypothetical protein EVG20_g1568 [Dentipellis fragilis]
MASTHPQNIVIVGAGIIGASTAYYLSLLSPSTKIHLVEASPELFASASGKAAGFLARDWFSPATASLGKLSFDMHKKLAEEHDGGKVWGYSPSTAFSMSAAHALASGARGEDWLFEGTSRAVMASAHEGSTGPPQWLAAGRSTGTDGTVMETISGGDTTAIVDPLLLSRFLLKQSQARGAELHHPATPTSVQTSADNVLTGITIRRANGSEATIPCDALVLTAGVWTPRVFSTLFPSSKTVLPISQLSGHSIVLRSRHWTHDSYTLPTAGPGGCHAAFASDSGIGFAPEIFSRAAGDIYLAGLNTTTIPVPELATDAAPTEEGIKLLEQAARQLLGDDKLDVIKTGFCHRPVTASGKPLLAALDKEKTGVTGSMWVCAGHGPWGISMSLGTGLVLAESILGRPVSVDVSLLGL